MTLTKVSRVAVFLDRDGVINEDCLGSSFITAPDHLRLLPGSAEAIRLLNDAGLPIIVITNQEAIAFGLTTEAILGDIHSRLRVLLMEAAGAHLDAIYYCPFHPAGLIPRYTRVSELRKPGSGMLVRAALDLDLDLSRCFFVGDKLTDIEAGVRVACRTILVLTGPEPPDLLTSTSPPDYVAIDLLDAARWILTSSALATGGD